MFNHYLWNFNALNLVRYCNDKKYHRTLGDEIMKCILYMHLVYNQSSNYSIICPNYTNAIDKTSPMINIQFVYFKRVDNHLLEIITICMFTKWAILD